MARGGADEIGVSVGRHLPYEPPVGREVAGGFVFLGVKISLDTLRDMPYMCGA